METFKGVPNEHCIVVFNPSCESYSLSYLHAFFCKHRVQPCGIPIEGDGAIEGVSGVGISIESHFVSK